MSRCLPYTRPNYKREDVSLIGSIKSGALKLLIQWGSTKQRKQVSRKVHVKLNKKRSREDLDNLDSLQHKNKKRKAEKNIKFNESCHYARIEDSDHFERSDLSEEHYPPALVLNKCNSCTGSQNSSEKNAVKDSDLNNKRKPGMVIRIKLPQKNHKDVEPQSASTDIPYSFQVTKSFKPQAVFTDSSPPCSSEVTKPSKAQTVLIESASRCCSQLNKPSNSKSDLTESSLRTKEVPSAKKSAEPCFSGLVAKAPIVQEGFVEVNPTESRQYERSTQRSERQLFRDLIINWKPPPFQPIEADEGELDWLFALKKPKDAKPSAQICKTGISDPSACPTYASSLQPRATYLPEFDMYQLPYVIPF